MTLAVPMLVVTTMVLACAPPARQSDTTVQQLLERFNSASVFWRQLEVAKELAAHGDARALVALEPLLGNDDRHVRANAAFVFARLGDPRGLATIRGILADRSDRPIGQGIPRGAANLAEPGWWMRDQVRANRYYAVHMLGELRDRSSLDVLVPLLGDPDVNYKVAWALGEIGDARAIGPLIKALEDGDAHMRVSAIQALEALDAKEAIPQLQELLNDRALPSAGPRVPVADTAKAAIRRLMKQAGAGG